MSKRQHRSGKAAKGGKSHFTPPRWWAAPMGLGACSMGLAVIVAVCHALQVVWPLPPHAMGNAVPYLGEAVFALACFIVVPLWHRREGA